MNEDTCMLDTARYFLDFIRDESFGKCVSCRVGTKRMLEILERITAGEGQEGDVELLLELGGVIKDTAMCGLGQTAPNPVSSTIKYFCEEYDEHIHKKYCRAGVCAEPFISHCENSCPVNVNIPGYLSLIAVECIHRQISNFDITDRRNTNVIEGSNFLIEVDTVITVAGQCGDLPFVSKEEIKVTPWGTFVMDEDTKMTKMSGVFAGGNVVRGPDEIIRALADGKNAVRSINLYLKGNGVPNKGEKVEGSKNLQASCITKAVSGMEIKTNSERVKKRERMLQFP